MAGALPRRFLTEQQVISTGLAFVPMLIETAMPQKIRLPNSPWSE